MGRVVSFRTITTISLNTHVCIIPSKAIGAGLHRISIRIDNGDSVEVNTNVNLILYYLHHNMFSLTTLTEFFFKNREIIDSKLSNK